LKSPEAIELLAKALNQKDPNVRGSAVKAFSEIGSPEVYQYIVQSLRDSHVIPRLAAVQAAGELKIADAIPYLEYQFKQDPEKKVKEQALVALGKIGTDACSEILKKNITDEKIPDVYRALIFSVYIENFGTKLEKNSPFFEFFIKAMNDKTRTLFTEITRKIFASTSLNFIPFIAMLLEDKDFTTRLNALAWLERNKVKDLLDTIKKMSETDPVETVRKKAQSVYENLH
ncbi:MAG TPA: HEAT repeat domain-containing protein, partial [Spirochaetales bacterium]|nr:HEAT repeat domain-containing protein [Spirochaetales bacterium]